MKPLLLKSSLLMILAAMPFSVWGYDFEDFHGIVFSPGVVFGQFESSESSTGGPDSLSLSFAKPFTPYFSLRADYANGVSGDDKAMKEEAGKLDVDYIWSAFGKFNYGSEWSQFYALLGYSYAGFQTDLDAESPYLYSTGSPSFGVGASMKIQQDTMMALEYISYVSGGDVDFSAFGVRFEQMF